MTLVEGAPSSFPHSALYVRDRAVTFVIVCSVVFLNFVIADFSDYSLTVAPFSIAFLGLFILVHRFSASSVLVSLTVVSLPLLNLFQIAHDLDAFWSFLRSYALWTFAVFVMFLFVGAARMRQTVSVMNASSIVIVVVTGLCSLQVIVGSKLGYTELYSVFGEHLLGGAPDLRRFVGETTRAIGFYYEPSFCALVLISMITIQLLESKPKWGVVGIAAFGVVVTTSISGILSLLVLGAVYGVTSSLSSHGLSGRRQLFTLLIVFGLVGAFTVVAYKDYVLARSFEIGRDGASIHYRLVAPMAVVKDVLLSNPTGMVFGKMEEVVSDYHLLNGTEITETIDNGVYLLVFYFGWTAVCAFLYLTTYFGYLILLRRRTPSLFFGYILLGLNFNGAVFSPEDLMLFLLVLCAFRMRTSKDKECCVPPVGLIPVKK